MEIIGIRMTVTTMIKTHVINLTQMSLFFTHNNPLRVFPGDWWLSSKERFRDSELFHVAVSPFYPIQILLLVGSHSRMIAKPQLTCSCPNHTGEQPNSPNWKQQWVSHVGYTWTFTFQNQFQTTEKQLVIQSQHRHQQQMPRTSEKNHIRGFQWLHLYKLHYLIIPREALTCVMQAFQESQWKCSAWFLLQSFKSIHPFSIDTSQCGT